MEKRYREMCKNYVEVEKMLSQVKDEEKKETILVSIICYSMALKKITKEISIDI
jgi:hypothetical protein